MRTKNLERVAYAVFVAALLFVGYVAGSLSTLMATFPATYVRDAYKAADALSARASYGEDPYASNLWTRIGDRPRGVTVHDRNAAYRGLTLYASGHGPRAVLVDMEGRAIHQWHRPFKGIWDESAAVRDPVPEHQIHFRKAQVFPNGELLAIYEGVGDTPWGYGMVKLDKDSNVVWKRLENYHHDFDVTEAGRVYALTHEFRETPLRYNKHLQPPFLDDFLVVLSPEGRMLRKVSLIDAVQNSRYAGDLWRILHFTLWDPLHTNNVDVLTEQSAAALRAKVPVAAEGQVLLSFRELAGGTIALLDVDKKRIVWAMSGSWKSQHDPDILPNGNILMFDNLGNNGPGGASRVIEVDPTNTGIVWSYTGSPGKPLYSPWRSAQEVLPNGNILITESNGCRIVEVNRKGQVVWEYVNPVRGRDQSSAAVVSWAARLDPGMLAGAFRDRYHERLAAYRAIPVP